VAYKDGCQMRTLAAICDNLLNLGSNLFFNLGRCGLSVY
jgi:hypothetical protein